MAWAPRVFWPRVGKVPVTELILRRLLPAAHDGASRTPASTAADPDRYLGIIERRRLTLQNGAAWQTGAFHRLYEGGNWTGSRRCGG